MSHHTPSLDFQRAHNEWHINDTQISEVKAMAAFEEQRRIAIYTWDPMWEFVGCGMSDTCLETTGRNFESCQEHNFYISFILLYTSTNPYKSHMSCIIPSWSSIITAWLKLVAPFEWYRCFMNPGNSSKTLQVLASHSCCWRHYWWDWVQSEASPFQKKTRRASQESWHGYSPLHMQIFLSHLLDVEARACTSIERKKKIRRKSENVASSNSSNVCLCAASYAAKNSWWISSKFHKSDVFKCRNPSLSIDPKFILQLASHILSSAFCPLQQL